MDPGKWNQVFLQKQPGQMEKHLFWKQSSRQASSKQYKKEFLKEWNIKSNIKKIVMCLK